MAKSCKGLAMELVKCLSETNCVKVDPSLPPSPRVSSRPRHRLLRPDLACRGVRVPPAGNAAIVSLGGGTRGWIDDPIHFAAVIEAGAVQKRPYKECAGEKVPSITSECVGLRETYFNCKRGQVDMRARIRGNKGY
ncbi:hypothetical protein ABZP36_033800 [Zizania latifolia]